MNKNIDENYEVFNTILYEYLTPKQFTKLYTSNKIFLYLFKKLNINKIYYTPETNIELYESVDEYIRNPLETIKKKKHISQWNIVNITNTEELFANLKLFNEDISDWNVSNVENMNYMFSKCGIFNIDISNWNINNVKYATGLFYKTFNFNYIYINKWFLNDNFYKRFNKKIGSIYFT